MPNWRSKVRRKLADSKLSADEREEISRELAGYLEDFCDDASARGLGDSAAGQIAATQSAAAELHEDAKLGAHLYRARRENSMHVNERTKRLWLPGLAVLLIGEAALYLLQYEFRLQFSAGAAHKWYVGINLPWLCALPVLGAVAAYYSRKQGAGRATQAAAGLFPFLVFVGNFFGGQGVHALPIRVAFSDGPWGPYELMAMHLPWIFLGWFCIPVAALLLGVLPILWNTGKPQHESGIESRFNA